MNDKQYAFIKGYELGAEKGEDASYREAEAAFPNFTHEQIEYACCGSVDGAVADLWRVNRILSAQIAN